MTTVLGTGTEESPTAKLDRTPSCSDPTSAYFRSNLLVLAANLVAVVLSTPAVCRREATLMALGAGISSRGSASAGYL